MIAECSMSVKLFYDCKKKLIEEKIMGVITLKQGKYVGFDSAIIKLPQLIWSVLTGFYSLMVKIWD